MKIGRRQALTLAALGIWETRRALAAPEDADALTRVFDISPSGFGSPEWAQSERWPQFPLLGVLCTISWGLPPGADPKKAGTYDLRFRGLQLGYSRGKALLPTEWSKFWIYRGTRLFGRKQNERDTDLVWEIPLTKKGKNLAVGKPVQTPYRNLELSPALRTGYAEVYTYSQFEAVPGGSAEVRYQTATVDFLDEDLNPTIRLKGLTGKAGFPCVYGYGKHFRIETTDPSKIAVTGIVDATGQLIGPLIPLSETQMFVAASARPSGGFYENFILGVATGPERKSFYPISPDGLLPVDPLPFKGYYPTAALPAAGEPEAIPTKNQHLVLNAGWLKEYALPSGTAYGWVNFNLTYETGPVWRSIRWHPTISSVAVGELLSGGWMVYLMNPAGETLASDWKAHVPMLPEPATTREDALRLFAPIYQEKIVKPREEGIRREREAAIRYWEERRKDNVALLRAHGYQPGSGKESSSDLQIIAKTIRAIQGAIDRRHYLDYSAALDRLPFDWKVRYQLYAPRIWYGQTDFRLDSKTADAYARSVSDPALATLLRERGEILRSQEEAQKKENERAAAEQKKQADLWAKQPRATGRVYTAPTSAGWLYSGGSSLQPVNTIRAEAMSQYMKDLGSYIHGNSIWKPTLRY